MLERGHRVVVAIAVLEWLAVATGAFQTSSRIALNAPQLATAHVILGVLALLAVLGLCLWGKVGRTALWVTLASLAMSGVTGWISPASAGRVVWHAIFSHSA